MWNHGTRKGDTYGSRDEQILLSVLGLRRGKKFRLHHSAPVPSSWDANFSFKLCRWTDCFSLLPFAEDTLLLPDLHRALGRHTLPDKIQLQGCLRVMEGDGSLLVLPSFPVVSHPLGGCSSSEGHLQGVSSRGR